MNFKPIKETTTTRVVTINKENPEFSDITSEYIVRLFGFKMRHDIFTETCISSGKSEQSRKPGFEYKSDKNKGNNEKT